MKNFLDFRLAVFAVVSFLASTHSHGQSLKDHLSKGDRFYQRKDYANAIINYKAALNLDAENAMAHYKLGVSYVNERAYGQAVTYLDHAIALDPEVPADVYYYLGMACQKDHQFEKARKHYETFKTMNKSVSAMANEKIRECIAADSIMQRPALGNVIPIGNEINSRYADLGPLVRNDGLMMIFTSSRTDNEFAQKSSAGQGDVFQSARLGDRWSTPEKIGPPVNVALYEAAVWMSPDGTSLLLYYEDGQGDIYSSDLVNGKWSQPVALNRFINHPDYREASACISPDGKRLFFSSNRPGGKGGYDLYVCEKGANEQWGRPTNLGSVVNTRKDEHAPFVDDEGNLYFSSDGHPGLGDMDVYRTRISAGKWATPYNLGYPINTSAYESDFVWAANKTTAYFTSDRNSSGADLDIFTADLSRPDDADEGAQTSIQQPDMVGSKNSLRGKVSDASGEVSEAKISLIDNTSGEVVAQAESDGQGIFEIVIPREGNYGVSIEKEGYLFSSMNVAVPDLKKFRAVETRISLQRPDVGSKVILRNVFFDLNQSHLKDESLPELNHLRQLLQQNPKWRVQINGHTDNVGHPTANLALSLKRAQAVVDYLVQSGIAAERLQAKGFGSERPLVSNDDEVDGRQINRRTEIELID